MKKAGSVVIWLLAIGVCAFMTYLTLGAGWQTMTYNLAVLGVMIVIILLAVLFGFMRAGRAVRGLRKAIGKLMVVYRDRSQLAQITKADAQLFEVEYLDVKYREYLGYLRRTNSPCDIGDYVGEFEINNYIHRRLLEMVPDMLTSLGILGTFMGLIWGLRGFNPVSYEAMAVSITSLIDGIKVAFVTSIYGIALSLAFSYSLRSMLVGLSEALDDFTDKYYVVAVTPTDATAMNHILENQRENTNVLRGMTSQIAGQVSESMRNTLSPVMENMNATLDNFTQVVTMNQAELMEAVAASVSEAIKKEFMGEFREMRSLLQETNQVQSNYLDYTTEAQEQIRQSLMQSTQSIGTAAAETSDSQKELIRQMQQQQEHLREFVEYMSRAMQSMTEVNEASQKTMEAVIRQMDRIDELTQDAAESAKAAARSVKDAQDAALDAGIPTVHNRIEDIDELTERLDRVISLMEKQQRQKKRRLFDL